tara:strand:- start:9510 stop:9713 length:204 start_codon:yes stop_codon:yes gene_type:complete
MREREIQDCLDWYEWAIKNNLKALRNENGNFFKTIIKKYSPLNRSEISQLKELKLYLKNHLKNKHDQ